MEPQPGLMVTGNLRLSRLLGKGGMGSVWVADHLALDTEVAVKFIDSPEALKNSAVLARFKREAGIAAKLKSPHAVQTFDHGLLPDGMPYIVMELLEGESLQDRLLRHHVLSLHETLLVVTQTAQVLSKAHKLGIVHRDLKPANLFLVDTGYELFIKLLDFGIAKHVGGLSEVGLTKTGTILGSPQYMSPEQFLDVKGVDHRGDLWSLAVVTYHCLTGTPAFLGQTLGQVILSVTNGTYQPITQLRPVLPSGLDGWFAKAFHRQIEQRFQSAKEQADALVAVVREHEGAAGRARLSSSQQLPTGVAPVRPPTAELPAPDGSAPWPVQAVGAEQVAGAEQAAGPDAVVASRPAHPAAVAAEAAAPGSPSSAQLVAPIPTVPAAPLAAVSQPAAAAMAPSASDPYPVPPPSADTPVPPTSRPSGASPSPSSPIGAGSSGAYGSAPVTEVSAAWPLSSSANSIQQTLSPAATTLDEEPKSKRLMLAAAAGALLLVGAGVGIALVGTGGAGPAASGPAASGPADKGTLSDNSLVAGAQDSAPLQASTAQPSAAPKNTAQAALAEPAAGASAEPSARATASAAKRDKPVARPRPYPRPRPYRKPKPSGYRPDMGF